MITKYQSKFRRCRLAVLVVLGAFVFYTFTVGLVPAVNLNMEVGRFRWLSSVPGASKILEVYEWPARYLVVVPGMARFFQFSEDFWCRITSAPVCVLYATHHDLVLISDVPKDIVETFQKACPQADVVSVSKLVGGKTGKEVIHWVFRFQQSGKLREASINNPTIYNSNESAFIYDVQNP